MELTKEQKGDLLLIVLKGNLVLGEAGPFRESFEELCGGHGGTVAIDMRECARIDSSGIGDLIKCLQAYSNLVLFGLRANVYNTFQLARLADFFPILTTEEFQRKYGNE
jgi:anti-anti-sigma factor